MEALLSLIVGVGLSAACGFRIFIPPLVLGLAERTGHLTLAENFEWMSSTPALLIFGSATLLEIGAYYIPLIDNLLDGVAAPSAVIAGTIMTASQVGEMDPLLGWAAAIIAGGGAAGVVQGFTTVTRQFSAFTTAGLGNPIVSTLEAGASIVMTLLAIIAPMIALAGLLVLVYFLFGKLLSRRKASPRAIA